MMPAVRAAATKQGLEVTTFTDGRDATAAIPSLQEPDLFLLAVLFPNGNAYEVAPLVRQHHPQAQIWLMSARADDMRESIESDPNFDRMVMWPNTFDGLVREIMAS